MATQSFEKPVNEAIAKGGHATETMLKGGSDALLDSVKTSSAAFKELAQAYQDVATKNIENLNAAVAALAEIKKPADFLELQQKFVKTSIETAVNDGQRIAKLFAAAYAAPFLSAEKHGEATLASTQH